MGNKHEITIIGLDMPFHDAMRTLAHAKRAGSQASSPPLDTPPTRNVHYANNRIPSGNERD